MPAKSKPLPKYLQRNLSIDRRVDDLLSRMTLAEQIAELRAGLSGDFLDTGAQFDGVFNATQARKAVTRGVGHLSVPLQNFHPRRSAEVANEIQEFALANSRLHIPIMIDGEGLHGCVAPGSTSYPQSIALAATWHPALIERIAIAISTDMRARGVRQVLSPVLDVSRDARAGRTEETYGEDPVLITRMAVAFVKGIQSQRLVATPKHYVANFVGDGGRDSNAIHISERLLREIYLPPFEAVFKEAGAMSVMGAYHTLDGVPCCASKWLLTDLLRGEYGFKGYVVSDHNATDYIAVKHFVAENMADAARKALNAGMDMELAFDQCFRHIPELVRQGKLSREVVKLSARRALYVKFWAGLFDDPCTNPDEAEQLANCPAHRQLALEAARQSIVLLKNNASALPLKRTLKKLAVIGPSAAIGRVGGYANSHATSVSPLAGLRQALGSKVEVSYAEGCGVTNPARNGFAQAVRLAKKADAVVLVMGNCPETEGEHHDRCNLDLPGVQEDLIRAVAAANPNTIVVLVGGSAITMQRWIDRVPAIVMAWYPGQEGGTALAEILLGRVNPSGKLPLTFPKTTGQCPLYYNAKPSGRAFDYCDLRGEQAQFPFGFGLSYTQFQYPNLRVRQTGAGKKLWLDVRATITNTGARDGDEIVQLYIHDECSERSRPLLELKGFQRVSLKAGQSKAVKFTLGWNELAYLGDDLKPTLEPGNIEILLGASSQDLRLRWGARFKELIEIDTYTGCSVPPVADIRRITCPAASMKFQPLGRGFFTQIQALNKGKPALVYLRTTVTMSSAGKGELRLGADGAVRVWRDRKPIFCERDATGPLIRDYYIIPVRWKKGANELVIAVDSSGGKGWGITAKAVRL